MAKWVKGQSGNPGGRAKLSPEENPIRLMRAALREVKPGDKQSRTHLRIIIDRVIWNAEQGSNRAQELVFSYLVGKPVQQLNLDANMSVTSREEHLRDILESLAVLEGADGNKPPIQ